MIALSITIYLTACVVLGKYGMAAYFNKKDRRTNILIVATCVPIIILFEYLAGVPS